MNRRTGIGLSLLLGGMTAFLVVRTARGQEVEEYAVKAAFLYKLCQYTTWPEAMAKRDQFVIGVVGKDPFGSYLEQIAKERNLNGKTIVVQRFPSANDIKPSHVLFIAPEGAGEAKESAEDRLREAAKRIQDKGTLVVGDTKLLAEKGAMINFVLKDQRVQFEVNVRALRNGGLQMSPNVLRLGVIIDGGKDATKE